MSPVKRARRKKYPSAAPGSRPPSHALPDAAAAAEFTLKSSHGPGAAAGNREDPYPQIPCRQQDTAFLPSCFHRAGKEGGLA